MSELLRCHFCGEIVPTFPHQTRHTVLCYSDAQCGKYWVDRTELAMYFEGGSARIPFYPDRLRALLKEREIRREPPPLLVFGDKVPTDFDDGPVLRVRDLLAQWPETIPERIERSFCCLVRAGGPELRAGQIIQFDQGNWRQFLPFALELDEMIYFVKALTEYGWIVHKGSINPCKPRVTPKGWEKYHELTGLRNDARNPVFVAMWFGKKGRVDRSAEMSALFEGVIEPACNAAGFLASKANSKVHNDFIMGRIIEDIRGAPFVIAELTENSSGVYFEAGFAKGRGIDVIYCAPSAKKVHFDVSGVNLLVWGEDRDFFRQRLESWILGTVGRGPHRFDR